MTGRNLNTDELQTMPAKEKDQFMEQLRILWCGLMGFSRFLSKIHEIIPKLFVLIRPHSRIHLLKN